jgi:hypothetical protein
MKLKARRSDEAGFGAIGGQVGRFHVAVTATLTILVKAMVVIERREGKEERRRNSVLRSKFASVETGPSKHVT